MKYYEVSSKSILVNDLLEIANNSDPWTVYDSVEMKFPPLELLNKDPFIKFLSDRYKSRGNIFRFRPYSCFDWHKDRVRRITINMVLTPAVRSFCVFSDDKSKSMLRGIGDYVFDVEELVYKPDTYYAFNSQIPHSVYNFEDTRYLFNLEFYDEDLWVPFEDMVAVIEKEFNS